MSALRVLPSHTYDSLKQNVDSSFENFKVAWRLHVQSVQALQDSELWADYADTWAEYAEKYLPYKASTYRAYKLDVPFALLAESLNHSLTQHESRKLRQTIDKVCKDAPLEQQIATYTEAAKITGKAIPTVGELSASYQEVRRFYEHDVVEVNGKDVSTKDALSQAVAYAIYENEQRKDMHISESTSKERKSLKIRANRHILALLHQQAPDSALPEIDSEIHLTWYESKGEE